MLKNKWLSLVSNVDFMTFTILKLELLFMFLEFVIYLRASSQNSDNHLFNITYLHTTCTVF